MPQRRGRPGLQSVKIRARSQDLSRDGLDSDRGCASSSRVMPHHGGARRQLATPAVSESSQPCSADLMVSMASTRIAPTTSRCRAIKQHHDSAALRTATLSDAACPQGRRSAPPHPDPSLPSHAHCRRDPPGPHPRRPTACQHGPASVHPSRRRAAPPAPRASPPPPIRRRLAPPRRRRQGGVEGGVAPAPRSRADAAGRHCHSTLDMHGPCHGGLLGAARPGRVHGGRGSKERRSCTMPGRLGPGQPELLTSRIRTGARFGLGLDPGAFQAGRGSACDTRRNNGAVAPGRAGQGRCACAASRASLGRGKRGLRTSGALQPAAQLGVRVVVGAPTRRERARVLV